MAGKDKQDGLRVVIVGGSIAGLVLAHSLHRAGIDFVVLEARNRIDPQVGASIGIFANGARILDQLGVYEDIERLIEPPIWLEIVTGEGNLVHRIDSPQLMRARYVTLHILGENINHATHSSLILKRGSMGYPIAFLERRRVLKILFDRLPDPTKVFTNKKVISVHHMADGVLVNCDDGSRFTGDIVAGADGVHSRIRREMWRYAESGHTLGELAKDKIAMSSEYRCLFGISSTVPGLEGRTHYRAFNKNWSFLVIPGKDNRCFWFVFEKLDRTYQTSNIPRYTQADEPEFVKPFINRYVSQRVTFEAVWNRKIFCSLTALEEAQYIHWTLDRFVCLGDSIHKMTPNIGQGGNWAIESAAALANSLDAMNKTCDRPRPAIDHIRRACGEYTQSRRVRTKQMCDISNFATRFEALSTFWHRLILFYFIPNSGDLTVDVFCQAALGAVKLDFLPLPEKSLRGGMSFHTARSQNSSLLWRILFALPLLGLFFTAHLLLGSTVRHIPSLSGTGAVSARNQTFEAQMSVFYCVEWVKLHSFLPPISMLNYNEKLQIIGLMSDLAPLQIVWTIESLRRGNLLTCAALPAVFGIVGQWKGFGYVTPIYYFLHYVQSPLERYDAPDNRLVPTKYAKTLSAAVGIGYILPSICIFLGFPSNTHQYIAVVWQLFPICTTVIHRIFASAASDTTFYDRINNPRADMPYLRQVYAFGAAIGAINYSYLWFIAGGYTGNVLSENLVSQGRLMPVTTGFGRRVKYNQLIMFGSWFVWQLLHFRDLKKSGRLTTSWIKVIGAFTSTAVLFGPGVAMAVGWAWREEVIAGTKSDKMET